MKIHQNNLSLAVHTWWHSWNHYGMFGLSDEHSTLLSAEREGYVPLDAKEMYLKAVFNYEPLAYVMAVKIMQKKESEWAEQQCARFDDDFNEL